jgi:nitrate reductase cytochrome c-type subunit
VQLPKIQSKLFAAHRRGAIWPRGLMIITLAGAAIFAIGAGIRSDVRSENKSDNGSRDEAHETATTANEMPRFSVEIRRPSGPPRVATGLRDTHGNEVTVACSSCHTTRQPNHQNKTANDLDEFHGGMPISHGTVSCLSCHNANDYDALKLADGSRVEFADVMLLCGQCHGPQMKDYQHGAHGGMNGHWDLTRGPQQKNNCVDCHNPHLPQFPKMQPTFKPRDRFLEQPRSEH